MTDGEIRNELFEITPYAQMFFSDAEYDIMSEKSTKQTFTWLKWIMRIFGLWGWSKKFQCDDFALVWQGLHNLRHAKSRGSNLESVASGILWYKKGGTEPHAINIIRTETGWFGLEPQNNEIFKLTKEEGESAWLVLF